jgi:thioredoxin 1
VVQFRAEKQGRTLRRGDRPASAVGAHTTKTLIRIGRLPNREAMSVTLKDFYADWCGPCKTQDPIVEELEDDLGERLSVEKIDVDENQDIANEYQVRSIPTIVIEGEDGSVVEKFIGVTQREELESAIEQAEAA